VPGCASLGLAAAGAALLVAAAAAGCGAAADGPGPPARVSLPVASFPSRQQVAAPAELRIVVRNDGDRVLPGVAVSIDSFSVADPGADLQNPLRPVWIVDAAPGARTGVGGPGAGAETWALGRLAPQAARTFVWRVTPVRPGRYRVGYRVAAGLGTRDAAAAAEAAAGGQRPAAGSFTVTITGAPADSRVDPATGRVIRRVPGRVSGAGAGG
jgi:hypothetical protein